MATAAFAALTGMGARLFHSSSERAHAQEAAQPKKQAVAEDNAVRPFRVDVSQEAIDDLRRRIAATRWPDKETVADESQGVPLATIRELARYWATDYDCT